MPENDNSAFVEPVRQARGRIAEKLRAQSEHLQKLDQALKELRDEHEQLKSEVGHQFEVLEKFEPPPSLATFEALLAGVRTLITATLPEQVFNTLTEEASRMGCRAVAFDVRGKAAWGASAHGFGPQLTDQALRSLVVSLTANSPFRQVFETGGHFEGNSNTLEKNRNVVSRLKPDADDSILLLPVRSAGAVSAIIYADSGGKRAPLPQGALQILAEFAGAQLDRLMALSGGGAEPERAPDFAEHPAEAEELVEQSVAEAPLKSRASTSPGKTSAPIVEEPLPHVTATAAVGAVAPVELPPTVASAELPAAPAPIEFVPAPAVIPVSVKGAQGAVDTAPAAALAVDTAPAPAPVAGFEVSQLSEADQKIHKDARRFAKLLVSEIELYNKAKVADGRKNKDLYKRMKLDIDRSRQTYEQRFGKTIGKKFDYLHDELVRTLAGNDPSLLGSDYPGPYV